MTATAHTDPDTPRGCLVLTEPRLASERAELRGLIAARIQRGIRDGDVSPGTDPEAIAGFIVAVLTGMSSRARDGASRGEIDAIADQARGVLA